MANWFSVLFLEVGVGSLAMAALLALLGVALGRAKRLAWWAATAIFTVQLVLNVVTIVVVNVTTERHGDLGILIRAVVGGHGEPGPDRAPAGEPAGVHRARAAGQSVEGGPDRPGGGR